MLTFKSKYYLIEESITPEKVVEYVKKKKNEVPRKLSEIERKLKDSGINVEKIKKDAKNAALKDKKSALKNQGKNTTIKNTLEQFTKDLIGTKKYFVNSEKQTEIKIKNKDDHSVASVAGGILKSIGLLAAVLFVGTYLEGLAFAITGSETIAGIIGTVLIAPLTEELSKVISVKNNFTWEYFTIFNILEFTGYVFGMIAEGMNPLAAIITRMICVGGHLAYTLIHVEANKRGDSEGGFKLAFTLHALWNGLSVLFSAI